MFHVELAPLGGIFCPLKSDLGVFWPFRGTDFIMGKNKNANFSKSPHGLILKFCVVIREVILQKMAPILDPVNYFGVFSLISHCDHRRTNGKQGKIGLLSQLTREGWDEQLEDLKKVMMRKRMDWKKKITCHLAWRCQSTWRVSMCARAPLVDILMEGNFKSLHFIFRGV